MIWRVVDLAVEYVDIGSITLDPANVRAHSPKNLEAIKGSLRRFGQQKPIVVSEAGVVAAGNGTVTAARDLGWTRIAVVRTSLSGAELAAYGIADNRTGELADWDLDALAETLGGLQEDGVALAEIGFDEADLADLLGDSWGNGSSEGGGVVQDEVPDAEAIVNPHTQLGDVWLLGGHRLLCGDSTKREQVTSLLNGASPDVMVTDPPYGVAVGGDKGKMSIHGDLTQAVIPVAFAVAVEHLAEDARVYLFGGSSNWGMYSGLFDHHLRMQVRPIVWVKEAFVMRPNNYHSQFEMVYFGWKGKGGGPDFWYGDRKQPDVWQVARGPALEKVHPTEKPVEACAIPIRNSCPPSGSVYEPFAGSGATLIAAHQLGRTCYAIELDPRYCDVVCRRWQTLADEMPVLESTGEPRDFGLYDATQAA